MAIYAKILQESPVRLWGLSSHERLERMLDKAGVSIIQENTHSVNGNDTILLLRSDFLYDQRIIENMIEVDGIVLEASTPQGLKPVAAHVSADLADSIENLLSIEKPLREGESDEYPAGLRRESAKTLVPVYQKKLRKIDPPYLLPITEEKRRKLEKRLFAGSYKGVTDLVTKWLWPLPAPWVTGICARKGISPNQFPRFS
ncbi:MAG: CDP-alcohol phosphatidyltransferase, partial [Candidatus Marinimicrobia bacterium]|nr:CDP-alcohol phosphatidyltransferase [Candidatus Neomarinimicrobiota bacterium]